MDEIKACLPNLHGRYNIKLFSIYIYIYIYIYISFIYMFYIYTGWFKTSWCLWNIDIERILKLFFLLKNFVQSLIFIIEVVIFIIERIFIIVIIKNSWLLMSPIQQVGRDGATRHETNALPFPQTVNFIAQYLILWSVLNYYCSFYTIFNNIITV